jgi:carbohydrate-binding DOMON domain-containing protein
MVPDSRAHFLEITNSKSSEDIRLTNCPSVTATCRTVATITATATATVTATATTTTTTTTTR